MIQANQGLSDKSLSTLESAVALLDRLNREQPGDPRSRADLALGHHYISLQLANQGRIEESLRHQWAAIDLRTSLAEEFPKQLPYRIDLALSLSNLGSAQSLDGRSADALDSVRRANEIQRKMVDEHPDDPQLRHTLALSTRGMAIVLSHMGRWKESRPLYLQSVEIMDRIVVENPAVTEFRRVLATSATELGQFLLDHDEIDAGFNALVKARDQAETVRKTSPNDVKNLYTLASILRGIGKTRARQGKTAEALDSLRQAIAISEQIANNNNVFAYDLACVLALYSEVVGRAQPSSTKELNDSSQRHSDRAMVVLQQAVDRGYRVVDWIERDPELLSLHSRADFQALIKSLRQKAKPTPTGK